MCGILCSCAKEADQLKPRIAMTNLNGDEIQLGEQIEDPYKLENMQHALDLLVNDGVSCPVTTLEANGVYMRLLPNSLEQDSILDTYEDITFFDFPLDYEILDGDGHYYHDPSVADSDHTWQYCVVDPGTQFPPEIQQEILYDVFIPDLDCDDSLFYIKLEDKSYYITGNADEDYEDDPPVETNSNNRRNKKFNPSASVKIYDQLKGGIISLPNVKIVIKSKIGCKKGEMTTNSNGECTLNKSFNKSKELKYFIKWETNRFNIRYGRIGQAWTEGESGVSHWDYVINQNKKSNLYANIFRGAYRFFYGDRLGVYSAGMTRRTHIGAVDENGTSYCTSLRLLGLYADIVVKLSHENSSNAIISTTFHELAHQSHMLFMSRRLYNGVKKVVYESWASAVEWRLLNDYYNFSIGSPNIYNYAASRQYWKSDVNNEASAYTPLLIDLIDTYNQKGLNESKVNDLISGYTLSYIQDSILPTSFGLSSLYSSVKSHKLPGINDAAIDSLFSPFWGLEFTW